MQHDFILLDRSGSMSSLWQEALSSINGYIKKLADDKVDTGVTLAMFDGQDGLQFSVIRDRIIPSTWHPVSEIEAQPRGMTPLNDAIGRIVAKAEAGNYEKVAIIIMTDGHENNSKELSVQQAKDLLNKCRAKNWQVIFLGADFDNVKQAESYDNWSGSTLRASKANLDAAMMATASVRSAYGSGVSATMEFSDEQKEKFAKEEKAAK